MNRHARIDCDNLYCDRQFQPTRPWHRFCSSECRKQGWIREQIAQAGRTRSTGSRRATRDGRGVRPYILPTDDREEIFRKVKEARRRING